MPASVLAADAYPGQPPYLSASVTPNIMLFIDTSGSMLQNEHNQFFEVGNTNCQYAAYGYPYGWDYSWSYCVANNTNNWRTLIDAHPDTKMNIAKQAMIGLIDSNRDLRFGLFSFRDQLANIGGAERGQAGVLRRPIGSVKSDADRNALVAAIDGLYGRTATPLAEGLLEITRYYAGQTSLYGLNKDAAGRLLPYTSPIQYRCQRNFTIVITDGDATNDDNLPGTQRAGGDGNAAIAPIAYVSRDGQGAAAARTFSVCTQASAVADDSHNVTCPTRYEANDALRVFNGCNDPSPDCNNRPSAIRDVAMYANRADLRVGGVDLDGKSFDDPKFARQNMMTYTVGFAVDNLVLPSTAFVGGGKYYKAANRKELTDSLNDALSSIGNVVSNAGGAAASGTMLATADRFFRPLFHATGWWGELRCDELLGGALAGPCKPNAGAVIPGHQSRNIHSAGAAAAFAFSAAGMAAMDAEQLASLGATDAERKNVVNYLRGQDIAGYRPRPNGVLGDIVDGQPLVIGKPGGQTTDGDYPAFKAKNDKRGMVFVGANDGMLHGFAVADMTEFFAFVPSPVYPRLKRLTSADYGNGASNPHTYFVNGALRQQDLKLNKKWMTLLVGGLAQGGRGYFALDASSQAGMSSASAVKWEFTGKHDADLGYTFGAPIIYNVRTSAASAVPVVIVANGYESDFAGDASPAPAKRSALYLLDADDGSLRKKIIAPSGAGLSSPAGVDYPFNGVLDYVYAGDDSGKLWRFDLTDPQIGVPGGAAPEPKLIFDAGPAHPIIMRPAVRVLKNAAGDWLGNLVIFGTGRLLRDADRTDTATQTIYAVLDKMQNHDTTVGRASLVERKIVDTVTVSGQTSSLNGTFRKVSDSPALDLGSDSNDKLGWYLDLPVPSERLATTPVLLDDALLFGTGIPLTSEMCSPGKGWLMGLNPLTGSVTSGARDRQFSFIDINNDGRATVEDMVKFESGDGYLSGMELDGIPGEITVIVSKMDYASFPSAAQDPLADYGSGVAMQDSNGSGIYGGDTGGSIEGSRIKDCLKGDETCWEGTAPRLGAGIKVETTIWREIIQ